MNISNKRILSAIVMGSLLLGFVAVAPADLHTAQIQVNVASKEAARAAQSKDIDTIHRHLQRLINCLVGQEGEAFDLDAGNPCKEQDHGAMQDLQSVVEIQMLVDQALSLAKTGLMIEAPAPAQDVARAASKILIEASREVAEE